MLTTVTNRSVDTSTGPPPDTVPMDVLNEQCLPAVGTEPVPCENVQVTSNEVCSTEGSNRAVFSMDVEQDIGTTTAVYQKKCQDVQYVFVNRDWKKYNFIFRGTQSVGLEVFRTLDSILKTNSEFIRKLRPPERFSGGLEDDDRTEINLRYVKLGVESEDVGTADLYWRLINTLLEFNRVRGPLSEHLKPALDIVGKTDLREIHRKFPDILRELLVRLSNRQPLCNNDYGYINHFNPQTCSPGRFVDLTFTPLTCYFLEATDRVCKKRHAIVSLELDYPRLIFLGRTVESDITFLDSQPGYAIAMEDDVFGVDKTEMEESILFSCASLFRVTVAKLLKKEPPCRNVSTIEQRFLDALEQMESRSWFRGSLHYVPEGINKVYSKDDHGFLGYADLGLVSLDTGNGSFVNSVKDGVGRLQVFTSKKLRCYFYSDGGMDCVFHVSAGIYVSEDSRRTCKSAADYEAQTIRVYEPERFPETYDLGFDSE